jgi:hypothetical protein
MKNTLKITALALVLVTVLCLLVSCASTFGGIKANFERNNYELKSSEGGKIESEDGKVLTYTIHTFQKKDSGLLGGLFSTAIVWEFGSNADLTAALSESETLKGLLKDAQQSDLVNGNCVLLTINTEAIKLFKGESL